MIIVRLSGGLGNQLFQYAVGRRLALIHQTELLLDCEYYRSTPTSDTQRDYELWRYPISARVTAGMESLWCRLHGGKITGRLGVNWGGWRLFRERIFDFDNAVLEVGNKTYLSGYWQSNLYFEDIAQIIRSELTPIVLPAEKDSKLMSQMLKTNSVSVHFRRGDYVTQKITATKHGSCSLQYYKTALAKMSSLVCDPHFFVFSDDMEWVKQNMAFPGETTFVDHNDSKAAFQDLRLMSKCKNHVIANSSFSWWGAWLNVSKEKHVISPATWFADRRLTPTLMPEFWIRI